MGKDTFRGEGIFPPLSYLHKSRKGGSRVDQPNLPTLKGGFMFCGTDISDLGLEYAPELEDTYVYRPAATTIHDETFDGHTGGYFYGTSQKPKEFVLRCIFEETVIDKGFLTKIQHFFKVGKSGKLVFKRRPWCYYYVTVSEYDDTGITNYLNGVITIRMKAYYPFARCDHIYHFRSMPYHENIMANTAMYDTEGMAPDLSFTNVELTSPETKKIIIGNPGTERASLAVTAAGNSGKGVIIRNKTTNQEMKLVALSDAVTTDINKEVRIDGISGKTLLVNNDGTNPSLAFLYHDYGFLELEPGFPAERNIYVSYTDGNKIYVSNILNTDYVGKYIFVSGWHKIIDQPDKHTFIIDNAIENHGSSRTTIMTMNELEIVPVTTMNLSKLVFSFKPTFA